MYTIKQASARTGVSVPLLRAWERRYGIVAPARTAARYRLYDDAALARIHTMRRLVETGWSPSAAAAAILDETVPTLVLGTAAEDSGDGTNRGRASRRDAEALATGDGVTRVEAVTDEVLRAAIALDSVASGGCQASRPAGRLPGSRPPGGGLGRRGSAGWRQGGGDRLGVSR